MAYIQRVEEFTEGIQASGHIGCESMRPKVIVAFSSLSLLLLSGQCRWQ